LSYSDRDTPLTGVLHWNEARPGPGIMLIHGGAGLDEHARDQARRYAELGYTVLACDMYGDGVAGDRERVMACVTALRDDPAFLVRRGQAGLTALSGCPEVSGAIAAIVFCFGGMAALALARSGADLAGVVSIHGSLTTTKPAEPGAVTAKILVCHGAADPHVPMDDVAAFTDEMNQADADWQLTSSTAGPCMVSRTGTRYQARFPVSPMTRAPTNARSPPRPRSWRERLPKVDGGVLPYGASARAKVSVSPRAPPIHTS
jgi:dienelactone hydrolase